MHKYLQGTEEAVSTLKNVLLNLINMLKRQKF